MEEERLVKIIDSSGLKSKRPVGRPRTKIKQTVEKDRMEVGIAVEEAHYLDRDRKG